MTERATRRRGRSLLLAALAAGLLGCVGEDGTRLVGYELPPSAGFEPVSDALGQRCGALGACHGGEARNYRIYSVNGLRLSPDDISGQLGGATTAQEHAANYASTVLIEPELTEAVWLDGGAQPERLTLIRKARGSEAHKGAWLFAQGDPGDRCLLSWLRGAVDAAACAEAAAARP